jgi:hypothetical protein
VRRRRVTAVHSAGLLLLVGTRYMVTGRWSQLTGEVRPPATGKWLAGEQQAAGGQQGAGGSIVHRQALPAASAQFCFLLPPSPSPADPPPAAFPGSPAQPAS